MTGHALIVQAHARSRSALVWLFSDTYHCIKNSLQRLLTPDRGTKRLVTS